MAETKTPELFTWNHLELIWEIGKQLSFSQLCNCFLHFGGLFVQVQFILMIFPRGKHGRPRPLEGFPPPTFLHHRETIQIHFTGWTISHFRSSGKCWSTLDDDHHPIWGALNEGQHYSQIWSISCFYGWHYQPCTCTYVWYNFSYNHPISTFLPLVKSFFFS